MKPAGSTSAARPRKRLWVMRHLVDHDNMSQQTCSCVTERAIWWLPTITNRWFFRVVPPQKYIFSICDQEAQSPFREDMAYQKNSSAITVHSLCHVTLWNSPKNGTLNTAPVALIIIKPNGKSESAVKEAKKIFAKCKRSGSDIFLAPLDHRNTPPTGIQISPAQPLLNRRTRSLLPVTAELLKPSVADEDLTRTKIRLRQQQQARYYNRNARDLTPLEAGDSVRV